MFALRPYQQEVLKRVYAKIRSQHKKILLFAPTGAGKTIIASKIVYDAVSRGKKLLFIVHREILIGQTYSKFQKFGLDCGFIKAGYQENRKALVQIASLQTLPKRDWWREYQADVVILDEAHLTAFAAVVEEMMSRVWRQSIYIGLTATPWRLAKNEGMGDIFDDLVCAPMPHELIEAGFLVKPSYYSLRTANLDNVKTKNGEFERKELAIACDRPELISATVKDWIRLAFLRRTIAFTVNVKHALNLAQEFEKQGIPSAYVAGSTPIKTRQKIYQQLADGEILVLSSCGALSEGFDVPAVNAVILCRPTKSKALYCQQLGRGLRLSPETDKQDCIVLDQAGNVIRHGFVEDLKEVSLTPGKEKSGEGEAGMKVCPQESEGCGAILYAFQMTCPHCGYQFQRKMLSDFLKLTRVMNDEDWQKLEIYRSKLREAYKKSYAPGWAAKVFQETFGFYPPLDWMKGAVFGENPTEDNKKTYRSHLFYIASRKSKDKEWSERYFNLEFER
ncbi:MAG: DEAD/DEAH box helicase family protein [Xenococcaceae cyanobacterium]